MKGETTMLSTFAAGLIIVAFTAAMSIVDKDYEEKRREFENSD